MHAMAGAVRSGSPMPCSTNADCPSGSVCFDLFGPAGIDTPRLGTRFYRDWLGRYLFGIENFDHTCSNNATFANFVRNSVLGLDGAAAGKSVFRGPFALPRLRPMSCR